MSFSYLVTNTDGDNKFLISFEAIIMHKDILLNPSKHKVTNQAESLQLKSMLEGDREILMFTLVGKEEVMT